MIRVGIDIRPVRRGLGLATFVTALAGELARLGDVEPVLFGPLAPDGWTGAHRWPAALRPYPALDGPPGRIAARRARLDVMHFTANSGWARRGPAPFVLTVHDAIFAAPDRARTGRQRAGHRYWTANARRAAVTAAAVVSPSRTAADAVQRALGLAATPLVIANGVQTGAPAVAAGAPYVLGFGGRDPRKRVDLLVAGWRAAGLDAELRILAGAGLPPELATELAADARIELLPYLSRPALERELAGARALVYPSEDEGFGLPVIEAMALGTPVVSGLCAATREVGGDAIAPIDAADPIGSIAAALREIAAAGAARERQVAAGRAQAERYSWRVAAAAYRDLYRRVVDA